jgi:DNA-binding transcriptional MerR regulator
VGEDAVKIDPADLVDPHDIAERLGVQLPTVHRWQARKLLPEPLRRFGGVPVWSWDQIEKWAKETGRL